MSIFTDVDDVITPVTRQQLLDTAVDLMQHSISPEDVSRAFGIEVRDDETIFRAIVRSGNAENLYAAAVAIGRKFTPEGGSSWNDIAKWRLEYDGYRVAK